MTDFFATDEGFTDVLARRLRRRRRRRAGLAAASAGAAVVMTIAVLSTLDIGTDSLGVAPVSPAATGTPGATPSAAAPRSANPAPTGSAATPGTVVTGPASAVVPPPASAGPSSGPTRPAQLVSTTMQRTTTMYDNTSPCADTSGRVATGWCVQVEGPFTADHGQHRTSPTVSLCRLPGTGARAHFAGTLEADFALATTGQNSKVLWHYDAQHPNLVDDHTFRVDAGTCLQWQTTWTVRADDGTDIAPGDYVLEVTVNADNAAGAGDRFIRQDYDYKVT